MKEGKLRGHLSPHPGCPSTGMESALSTPLPWDSWDSVQRESSDPEQGRPDATCGDRARAYPSSRRTTALQTTESHRPRSTQEKGLAGGHTGQEQSQKPAHLLTPKKGSKRG